MLPQLLCGILIPYSTIEEKLMAAPITDFAAKLKALGIKNRDLANALGFRDETICRWVRGEREPPMAVRLLIDLLYENPLIARRHIADHLKSLRTMIQAPPRRSSLAVRTDKAARQLDQLEEQHRIRDLYDERFTRTGDGGFNREALALIKAADKAERKREEAQARAIQKQRAIEEAFDAEMRRDLKKERDHA
jgi:hypothetical protein